ncbi:MAG: hypothetical protein HYV03_07505 [Deltaproteobacteria bacterium]|nr:hypothetical protein [Deltaproteobacteria bacterium]
MIRSVACLLLLLFAVGCARQPSAGRANALIRRHFIHYAKKYPTSAFGQSRVSGVELQGIEEIHKHYVAATATVAFQDGGQEKVRCALEMRPPLGWRVVSWERLGPQGDR